ncbi:DUF6146 family protein [Flavobacterium sp.]|uniref:DUF6146 family protein n=1 Tax=Flavobacterium sp. TaxID=239 RepID=UPI00286D75EB|nr:DUF6146 family protein [Flavobacterium sp.]
MKTFFIVFIILFSIINCKTKTIDVTNNSKKIIGDTVKIANDELEYEVIIIDIGFSNWLNGRSFPRGYHSEYFLENKNRFYVTEWNNRASQPMSFDPNLYQMQIDYNNSIHYGYEVNYLIYNYMIYFQNTYKQRLFGYVPSR